MQRDMLRDFFDSMGLSSAALADEDEREDAPVAVSGQGQRSVRRSDVRSHRHHSGCRACTRRCARQG